MCFLKFSVRSLMFNLCSARELCAMIDELGELRRQNIRRLHEDVAKQKPSKIVSSRYVNN